MVFKFHYLKQYYLKLSINKKVYNQKLDKIKSKLIIKIIIEIIIILILSFIFTILLFIPLKKAYEINENFIKDLLHNFNTPLTTLKINLYLLSKEIGDNLRIKKIQANITEIEQYQNNLKIFLKNNPNQIDKFNIKKIIDKKLKIYSLNYPDITYKNEANLTIYTNKISFENIVDNLINNSFKYNKKNGYIHIYLKDNKLYIKDTGIGIKDTKDIFKRYYKETKEGIGIGLNIVKKLCDELDINIEVYSNNQGSTFILDLSNKIKI